MFNKSKLNWVAITDYVTVGLNDPEVTIDSSFYEFTFPEQTTNIKNKVKDIKNGGIQFKKLVVKNKPVMFHLIL